MLPAVFWWKSKCCRRWMMASCTPEAIWYWRLHSGLIKLVKEVILLSLHAFQLCVYWIEGPPFLCGIFFWGAAMFVVKEAQYSPAGYGVIHTKVNVAHNAADKAVNVVPVVVTGTSHTVVSKKSLRASLLTFEWLATVHNIVGLPGVCGQTGFFGSKMWILQKW